MLVTPIRQRYRPGDVANKQFKIRFWPECRPPERVIDVLLCVEVIDDLHSDSGPESPIPSRRHFHEINAPRLLRVDPGLWSVGIRPLARAALRSLEHPDFFEPRRFNYVLNLDPLPVGEFRFRRSIPMPAVRIAAISA